MACCEHVCPECGHCIFNNYPSASCPECGSKMTTYYDEEPDED